MISILSELQAFEILLGGARGGHRRAAEQWWAIGELVEEWTPGPYLNPHAFDRLGWICLAIHAVHSEQHQLLCQAITAGLTLEEEWLTRANALTPQSEFDTVGP